MTDCVPSAPLCCGCGSSVRRKCCICVLFCWCGVVNRFCSSVASVLVFFVVLLKCIL